jgi:hypothetical protein
MTTSSERGTVTNTIERHPDGYHLAAAPRELKKQRRLLIPVHDLVPVHVCWDSSRADDEWDLRLTAVEFTHDCEVCAVETDPTDGDCVSLHNEVFHIDGDYGDYGFRFAQRKKAVGNIMWDMIWMPKAEAGRFAEYLQEHKHWTLTVAVPEIFDRWGNLTGEEFIRILEELSR